MLNFSERDGSLILPIVSNAVVVGTTTRTTCNPGIATTTIRLIATTISVFVVLFRKYFLLAGILSAKAVRRVRESTDLFLLLRAKKNKKGQIVGNEICPLIRDDLHLTKVSVLSLKEVLREHCTLEPLVASE